MIINFEGKSRKLSKKEANQILVWSAERLMGDRLSKNVEVTVCFRNMKKEAASGFCWPEDFGERYNRIFCIEVNTNKTRRNQIRTLLHEMVHVKQHARGELRYDMRSTQMSRWLGELHNENDYEYWELPWEIEAYGREEGLYRMYLEHKKKLAT
jgi:hypothetical protein